MTIATLVEKAKTEQARRTVWSPFAILRIVLTLSERPRETIENGDNPTLGPRSRVGASMLPIPSKEPPTRGDLDLPVS